MNVIISALAVCLSFTALSRQDTVYVYSADQLIDSIRSNCLIILSPGEYSLSSTSYYEALDAENTEYHDEKFTNFVHYNSGWGVTVTGVSNLTIRGGGAAREENRLVTKNKQDHILTFDQCTNIRVENLEAEHWPATGGGCDAGVWFFSMCNGITIDNNHMLGSGNIGIDSWRSKNITVTNSVISECTAGIVQLKDSWTLKFKNCEFRDNIACNTFWYMSGCTDVQVENCMFLNNIKKERRSCSASKLFSFSRCELVVFKNNTIKGNECHYLGNKEAVRLLQSQNIIKRNKFDSMSPAAK